MKKFSLFLVMAFILVSCGGQGLKEGGDTSTDTIRIGGLAPLTGEVADYGITASNGAKLAFKEINAQGGILGKQVEFLLEDEKGDMTEAVNAYSKLLDEEIVYLWGDVTSGPSVAVAELAHDDNMPMITPTGTQFDITESRPNVFRACFTDPYQGSVLAGFTQNTLKAKTVAIMTNNSSDYAQGVAKAFKEKATELGLEIVAEEGYGNGDSDFRGQLTSIKSKNPDVLFVPDYYRVDALIALQADEIGLASTIVGADGWDGVVEQVTEDKWHVLDRVYYSTNFSLKDKNEKIKAFVENYRKEYGSDPSSFAVSGYDAAYIIKEAIEKAGSLDKKAIIQATKDLAFQGVAGSLHYDENNNPVKDITMIKIENGQYEFHSVEKAK